MKTATRLILLAMAALLWPAEAHASGAGASCALTGTPSCGSQVLQRVFQELGVADEGRVSRALSRLMTQATKQKGFNSLDELKHTAEDVGLHTRALQVDLEALQRLTREGIVIANVTGNRHFCVITGVDQRGVSIYDPGLNFPTPAIPPPLFLESWDGRVLVVSRRRLSLKNLPGQIRPLSRQSLKTILGGQPCENISGDGGDFGGGGWSWGNGPAMNSSPSSTAPSPPTTTEPVQLTNGNLFLEVTDLTVPTRGLPLEFTRYYNAQTTSEVPGWLPEPGAGSWVIENGEYSGQGNRAASDLQVQDFTLDLDLQTLQAGVNPWETAWVNFRYTANPSNPREAYNGYYFLIHTDGKLELSGWRNGSQRFLYNKPSSYRPTTKNRIRIQAQGSAIKVFVNGALEITYTDPSPLLAAGRIVLEANFSHAHFDNIVMTSGGSTTTADFSTDDNDTILGLGWTHTYAMRIREYANHVTLIRENNARELYVLQADGSYQSVPVNTYTTLTKDASGFSVKTKHGLHYRFNLVGNLRFIEDRHLNRTTLTYGTLAGKAVLTTVTEPTGRTLTFQYGATNRVSVITDPAGNRVTYTYDAAGHLIAVKDRLGGEERYAYDSATHNLIELTDKEGNRYQYTYTYNDRVSDQTDPLGNRTMFDYLWDTVHVINHRGELYKYNLGTRAFLRSVTDPANVMERFDNDPNGNVTNHYDKNGVKTFMTYDAAGNRTGVYDPLGQWTRAAYEPTYNLPTSLTDARGHVTTFTYDARGNLLQHTDAMGGTTTYTYNAAGQILSVTDPKGYRTTSTYDAYGNLASTTDALGNTATSTYDLVGRRITTTDSLGTIARFTYDANGQVLSVTNALNQTMRYTYTPNGRIATVTDPLGNVTTTTSDCFGNVLTITDARGHITRFTYDTANQMHLNRANRLTFTDANTHTTTYGYDALDRLIRTVDAAGFATQLGYDNQGNRIFRSDANGRATTYQYDALNRLTGIVYADGTTVTYALDPVGNLSWMADTTGSTNLTYDALNRLIRKLFPDGTTFEYTLDRNGNRTGVTIYSLLGTWSTTSAYDALNRMTQLTAPDGAVTRFTYDQRSRRARLDHPNGVQTTSAYDAANHLTSLTTRSPTALIAEANYAYDGAGRRTQVTFTTGPAAGTLAYAYDPLSQLLQETGTVNGQAVSTSYTYDPLGNRTQRVQNGATTTSTYNTLNQLMSESANPSKTVAISGTVGDTYLESVTVNGVQATIGAGTFTALNVPLTPGPNTVIATARDRAGNTATHQIALTYQPSSQSTYDYDPNGNRTIHRTPSGTETLTYDSENRLQFFGSGATWATYSYNGLGERISKTVNGTTTKYYLDGPEVALEIISGTPTIYLHGPGLDEILSSTTGSTTRYYHQDGRGSVIALTDGTGALIATYAYEPFGAIRTQSGSASNPWGFTGRPLDVESGLHFLRNRYYDSRTGMFLTPDPIGIAGGINLYGYVGNDPVSLLDPFGLATLHYWEPEGGGGGSKGGWYGHVSLTLDDGTTYISYWPSRPIDPPFDSTPIRTPNFQKDKEGEGGREPLDIHLSNLDEAGVKDWWGTGNHGNFCALNNCSDVVSEALRQGGMPIPRHLVYHPEQVKADVDRLLKTGRWTDAQSLQNSRK